MLMGGINVIITILKHIDDLVLPDGNQSSLVHLITKDLGKFLNYLIFRLLHKVINIIIVV